MLFRFVIAFLPRSKCLNFVAAVTICSDLEPKKIKSVTLSIVSPSVCHEVIPVELFQILKDDAMKVLHPICQQIWKTQQWPQDQKMSVFIPIPKKGNAKECSNYHTITLTSHASKVMFKILQARLQQYVNHELPDVQAGFRKGRGTKDCQNLVDHGKRKRVSEKRIFLLY